MKIKDQKEPWHSAWATNPLVRIMKLTMIIMTVFLMQLSAAGLAQNVTFKKNNSSLKEFFTEIRKQTGYHVVWQEGKVNDAIKINAAFQATPLEQALEQTLSAKNLAYEIVNKTVVVKPKEKGLLDRIKSYFARITVSGKVLDGETNQPVPGVTVQLVGTNRATITDGSGLFTFTDVEDNLTVSISSIGYTTRTMVVQETMLIRLQAATETLQDVVISTGYQQLKKGSTTGSYSVVTAKDIESTPTVNLMERLANKVPGVQFDVRNNKIQIRGVSSYTAVPPLVVIDGFPAVSSNLATVTNNGTNGSPSFPNAPATSGNSILSTFNPNDIESITFLKDASATAIWGAQAANGVIVITTKRGKRGTSSINFNTTLSISEPANFRNLTSMNSADYIDLEKELFEKNFLVDPASHIRNSEVTEAQYLLFSAKNGNAEAIARRDAALSALANRSNTDQLRDYMLQRAVTQQYNVSVSGGGDNSSYYVSGNFSKDRPVFRSNYGQTYSLTSNLTNDFLKKRLTLFTGLNYTDQTSQNNSAALNALSAGATGYAPYEMLVDEQGNKIYKGVALTKQVSDDFTRTRNILPWTYNAIDELNYNNTILAKNSIRANASLKGKVTDWLSLTVAGQYQKTNEKTTLIQNENSYLVRNLINTGAHPDNALASANLYGTQFGFPKGSIYNAGVIERDDYSLRAQFDVNKNWGDQHHFDMIGGTEIRQTKSTGNERIIYGYNEETSVGVNANTYNRNTYRTIFNGSASLPALNNTIYKNRRRYLSYYSNASYSFMSRYFATASVRFDDINILGVDRRNRATPLWSAGLRWDASQEDFLKQFNWLSSLSLRASIGTSGNPPEGAPNYTTVTFGTLDGFTQLPIASIGAPANPDVGWETTKTTNFGVDAAFLNNRLSFVFEVYKKKTKDILYAFPINSTYGFSTLRYNAADMEGHGVEFLINAEVFKAKDWGWNTNLNFSYNTNKALDSRFPITGVSPGLLSIVNGYPLDNIFAYRWAGLSNEGLSQVYRADGSIVNGKLGSPSVTAQDLVYMGRTTAPYFGAFTNTFKYKNISLEARISYETGHKFRINKGATAYPTNGSLTGLLNTNEALANRWRNPGDEAFTDVPGLRGATTNGLNYFANSDLNIRDAANIRFQQLSLNYQLPAAILKKAPYIKTLTVGVTATNLGLLWVANDEGVDPLYQNTNTFSNLPPSRTYLLNLNLSF
ncbi:TonB-dependent Receptor Plug Domain protein [compost metagenome]